MKTKNKILAVVEIAIVLCSLFLVALPGLAADQTPQKVSANTITTASEDDYVLGVYGNANEDDTIDMRDLTYVKLIFFGKKPETELADAKYDGKINPLDFIQIKLIIVGKEKELTVVDQADRIVTVKKPVKRIIPFGSNVVEAMRSLKATDKIVGISEYVTKKPTFFPEFADLPDLGGAGAPDYEKIAELQPDLFILYSNPTHEEFQNKVESIVPGVTVVRIGYSRGMCKPEAYFEYVRLLGYILDRRDEAEDLLDWQDGYMDTIKAKTERLSEDKKPRVLYLFPHYFPKIYHVANRLGMIHTQIINAGGINIAANIGIGSGSTTVDPEWVLEQDPKIILGRTGPGAGGKYGNTEAEIAALKDKIMLHPGWGHIDAVKSDSVYLISNRLTSVTHEPIGTAYMAKWFHPELFEDLDPQVIHQEYLTRFQGLDYNVYEDAIFVYPQLKD